MPLHKIVVMEKKNGTPDGDDELKEHPELDDDVDVVDRDPEEDLLWDDGDPADRRRDPLRRPV
jgi:hypothetical protein